MSIKEILDQWAARKQVVTVTIGDIFAHVLIQGNLDVCCGMYSINVCVNDKTVAAVTFNSHIVTKIDGLIIEIDMSKETE